MTAPAFLLGSGLVSALGADRAERLRRLAAGRPADVSLPKGPAGAPAWPYCPIAGFLRHDRMHEMIERAVQPALDEAGLDAAQRRKLAILVGSTCLDLPLHEAGYEAAAAAGQADIAIRGPGYGNVAGWVAERFGIGGPQYTLNTACSSSANALLHARLLLDDGRAEHALVIGVEAFNRLSLQGFGSLLLLSKTQYRPFDRDRDGLILGEGAGAMVLGRGPRPGDPHPVTLCGAASACDPSSPTNSLPERVADVMRAALADAGIAFEQLVALKAHGTGTASNDLSEGQGMRLLADRQPPFTSLKPYVGHTLGGCGAIEALCVIEAWREGFLPRTPGFAAVDPAIALAPVTASQELPPAGAILCNFFGFGGNNTSLVLARA